MTSVGIDLGTTNSAAAKVIGGREEILDIEGDRTIRSVVTFAEGDNTVIVGNMAVDYMETHPELTVSSIKRHMGEDGYTVDIDSDEYEMTEYRPEEISALTLMKLQQGAEASLGEDADSAVITIPADFPESARSATRQAAELADVEALRLLPEPSAACVAYGLRERDVDIERVAVYDLGGGTFDISIVDVAHEESFYDVVATGGRQELGGDDFDEEITQWLVEEFEDEFGEDLTGNHRAMYRLRSAAKNAKQRLSASDSQPIRLMGLAGENLERELTREKFEELTGHLVEKTIDITDETLEGEGMSTEDIDTVLLVGGSTKMPQVKAAVEEYFGEPPSQEVNPDEAVAIGAGVFADTLSEKGLEGDDGGEEETDRSGLPRINNVVPQSIGIELASGRIDTIIEANDDLPVMKREEREYTTIRDGQTRAQINIYQGDGDSADDDDLELKSEFILDNIRKAKAGEPEITVQLKLDEDGVLSAHAWDESVVDGEVIDPDELDEVGGSEAHIDIEDSGGAPSEDDIARIRELLPKVR